MRRRLFLKNLALLIVSSQVFASGVSEVILNFQSNFRLIYKNEALKKQFFLFLKNVFHLFPSKEFHNVIRDNVRKHSTDKDIYEHTQLELDDITPWNSIFKYQLPALFKQKDEMARQAVLLLKEGSDFNGYLEIGSSGRYLDYLEEKINIKGARFYSDGKEPGYAITEMIDRGQICIGADYIPMASYQTQYSKYITNESLDLVTVYIGFHHCPLELRTQYISSIRDTMRIGGKLILRDHDCNSEDQKTLVALAHDVFNMGTYESWNYNSKEVRNFYSLKFICGFVENIGFKFENQTLFQEGDPTKNALLLFTKI